MIHVTIELWPYGREENKKTLGVINIANDATGTHDRGNYLAKVFRSSKSLGSLEKVKWTTVRVFGFPRHTLTAYDLLLRVLLAAQGKKNKTTLDTWFRNQ